MKYEMVDKFEDREKIMEFLKNHINRFIEAKDAYRNEKDTLKYKIKRKTSYIFFWTGSSCLHFFASFPVVFFLIISNNICFRWF
jgi:hypothetical protein